MQEIKKELPEHILPFWAQECWRWHTVEWWRWHWERTGLVKDIKAAVLPDGWKLWLQWKKARELVEGENPPLSSDIQVLDADQGRYMGFIKMTASKRQM